MQSGAEPSGKCEGGSREIKSLLTMQKNDPLWKPCKYGFDRARMHLVQLFHNNTYKQNNVQAQTGRWSVLIVMSHYILGKYYKSKKQKENSPVRRLWEKKRQPLKIRLYLFFFFLQSKLKEAVSDAFLHSLRSQSLGDTAVEQIPRDSRGFQKA